MVGPGPGVALLPEASAPEINVTKVGDNQRTRKHRLCWLHITRH